MASPFVAFPDAVAADPVGVAHYSDPIREQRALESGEAVVWLADRAVIQVDGPERLTWLDAVTSQAVRALEPGVSTELLILDPQGRIEHQAAVIDDGGSAWLIVDEPDADGCVAWLTRMVFRSQVTVTRRADLSVLGAAGGGAAFEAIAAAAQAAGGVALVWHDPWVAVTTGGHQYALIDEHPGATRSWCEVIVGADAVASVAARVAGGDLRAAGLLAAEALRIAAWRPRWQSDVDERTLPHELDLLRTAVHLNKGCYRGQESVAKVHNLGHPPRRIVFLHLDGVVPPPGAPVFHGDTEVGRVTSAAMHHELGPIALAVVKRNLDTDADLAVQVDDEPVAAAQETIVAPTAGAEAGVPRLPRLSARR